MGRGFFFILFVSSFLLFSIYHFYYVDIILYKILIIHGRYCRDESTVWSFPPDPNFLSIAIHKIKNKNKKNKKKKEKSIVNKYTKKKINAERIFCEFPYYTVHPETFWKSHVNLTHGNCAFIFHHHYEQEQKQTVNLV